jgi:hypothetical protein
MKVKLLEDTFTVEYEQDGEKAEFIFKNDQRVFLKLMDRYAATKRTDSDVWNQGIADTLIEIKGIGTDNDTPVKVNQFFLLPAVIVTTVRAKFLSHVMKNAIEEDEETAEKNDGTNSSQDSSEQG